jgi:hypothetical protein
VDFFVRKKHFIPTLKSSKNGWVSWHMPITPVLQEAEIGRITGGGEAR